LGNFRSPRVYIIYVTALQLLFVHVWVCYVSICTVMHPVRLSVVLDEISTCQALCTVSTKCCVLCQPNALYCANQELCTVPTKRFVLWQPSALYCANQALCTVPTKRFVQSQPSAMYCANQALCTVQTKRFVLCQPSAMYCANQALCTVPTKSYVLCQTSADTGQTSAIFIGFPCLVGHTHTLKQKD